MSRKCGVQSQRSQECPDGLWEMAGSAEAAERSETALIVQRKVEHRGGNCVDTKVTK